jgi:hypothetical protein
MTPVSRAWLVLSSLLGFVTLVLLTACDESGPRVYTAKAYDRGAQCLAADTPIGLVESEDLKATCEPVCIELRGELYVSTVCPPYPADSVLVAAEDSTDCAAALTALAEETECAE